MNHYVDLLGQVGTLGRDTAVLKTMLVSPIFLGRLITHEPPCYAFWPVGHL